MCSRTSDFEDVVDEGVDGGVGGINFATIAAHENEVFDVERGAATDTIEGVEDDIAADIDADFVDVAYGVEDDIATDVVEGVEDDIATNVVIDFVGVVSKVMTMKARERPEVVDVETSRDAVSTHLIAEKKSFEDVGVDGVDDEAEEAFSTAKKEEKNSDFSAVWSVDFDSFSGADFLA